jgi:hypothetical protein
MNNKFVLFTYYSEGTEYEKIFQQCFLNSVMNLKYKHNDLDWKVSVISNQGNWYKNVAEKANCILEQLESMTEDGDSRNLVYVDVDAEVLQYPDLFNNIPEEYDIALHFLEHKSWYGKLNSDKKELLTGTIFFRNNKKVKDFLKLWYIMSLENMNNKKSGQKTLESLYEEKQLHLNIYNLPIDYCYIDSLPNKKPPLVKCENPVIIHHQASRIMKRKVK